MLINNLVRRQGRRIPTRRIDAPVTYLSHGEIRLARPSNHSMHQILSYASGGVSDQNSVDTVRLTGVQVGDLVFACLGNDATATREAMNEVEHYERLADDRFSLADVSGPGQGRVLDRP